MIEKLLSSYRSAILLNGKKPSQHLLQKIRKDVPIIAADGAAAWGSADYIVGDMDSIPLSKHQKGKMIHIPDQDSTDFEKSMSFATEKGLLPSLIVGINGGEIDHFLGNIQALLKAAKDLSFFFLDECKKGLKIGMPLSIGTYRVKIKIQATVSILPHCTCTLTTNGLFWELKKQLITPNGVLAIRNRSAKEVVEFNIIDGKALIIIDL